MTFYDFLVAVGTESIFLIVILGMSICVTIFKCIVRICRCMNINKNGWPPPHCDADGDFKNENDCE